MTIVTESKESKKELQNILYSSVDAVTIVHEAKESLTITFDQQNNELIVLPYSNTKHIIGKLEEEFWYKPQEEEFTDIILKPVKGNFVIICPNFENNRNLVGIKARVELVAENCQNNSLAFKVKTLQIVRVYNVISPHHKVKIVKLSEIIEDKNYKFEDYKEAIEDLILGIKYIQDNNMIELPLFDSTKESFLQYSHNLCFFIINAINQYMAIDNAAFLFGNIIQRLRKARYKLLKYLEFKAAEEQKKQKNDPIFHDKLITGKILPLIILEKRNEKALIPCTVNNRITVPLSVKEQLIKYRKISRVSEKHVVLIAQTDIPSEKLFNKKYLGVLARLTTIHADLSSRVYVKNYVNLAIIPEKTVEVHIIKQEKLSGNEESKQDMFYCEVNILEYEVSNWDKLQQQVQDCFELVKEIRKYISYFGYSSKQLLGFDKNLTTDINHIINISYFYIEMLYGHIDVNTIKFLEATNLNQRYNQIKESLAKLLIIKHKQHVEEIMSKSHESTTEVNEIPEGYAVIIFDKAIAKFLPLSSRYKELTPDIYMFNSHILTTEQIIQNHYKGKQTILLIKEDFEKHNPNKNTIPSIKAKVINTVCLEDNTAHIRIIPESRVRVTEIVLKDGVFYGKAEEIEELAVSNEEELKLLRILIEQVIVAYTNKPDYDYLGRWYPVYESSKLNIETYAANLSYYLANEILGYDYDTSSDTNLMQEFCSKTTIEKLQYLLDTINGKNFNKTAATQGNNSSTQEIANTTQQEAVSKETKIDSNDVVSIIKSNNITSSTPTTSKEWIDLGARYRQIIKSQKKHYNHLIKLLRLIQMIKLFLRVKWQY
ncbi:hypothetical protein [Candidatus Tisiphia endosymbiont of Nemotelus uliginosus]|uniref:hypothetical protein n=1 Tax=Candidatus Tisiphia endosymbiont of Nemotelus uliginosus TaxID=3077926 RepID=UPI0035CA1B1B